ncbi:hypothetical protein FDC50_14950 [Clostridium botulinum]|nr:hypothetical protein KU41_15315 [Clostridium botulinum]MBY6802800.1 hypothetical protein [Clostridium botulinum]MBY6812919.1 hypothetical protein [Clostridium botulinum]MBY6818954.1 hypothetical protein [Clostridium botulinum]NFJ49549.1 hypothetical protein [Clostridium botulinum]
MEKSNNDLFDFMSKMYADLKDELSSVKSEQIKTNERLDSISSGIGKMVTNEVACELSDQLKEIKDDITFLTHKTTETEKDVYKIQSHLKIIK